jgi:hypothetical protein
MNQRTVTAKWAPRLLVFMDNLVIRINEPGKVRAVLQLPHHRIPHHYLITWRWSTFRYFARERNALNR